MNLLTRQSWLYRLWFRPSDKEDDVYWFCRKQDVPSGRSLCLVWLSPTTFSWCYAHVGKSLHWLIFQNPLIYDNFSKSLFCRGHQGVRKLSVWFCSRLVFRAHVSFRLKQVKFSEYLSQLYHLLLVLEIPHFLFHPQGCHTLSSYFFLTCFPGNPALILGLIRFFVRQKLLWYFFI